MTMVQPGLNEDANRAERIASAFFYAAGDLLSSSDIEPRFDPGMYGGPLMGPRTNTGDYVVGDGGVIVERGTGRIIGTQARASTPSAGLVITPGMLLIGALVFLAVRK